MEKPAKTKAKKPSKYLPRASTFSLPTHLTKLPTAAKGFSGPISIVPAEARHRRPRNSDELDLEAIQPRSPEVSCMGRVRSRKAMSRSFSENIERSRSPDRKEKRSGTSLLQRLLKGKEKQEREEDEVTSFGEMKRFASGRGGALAGFDWRDHVGAAAVEPVESPELCADEEEK